MTFNQDLAAPGGLEEPRTLSESERLDWLQLIRSQAVFPSPRNPDVPLSRDTVTRALQVNRERLGIEDVRVHDLRRTASSNMSALGVPKHVRERVLNHSLGRLDQSYDLYEYLSEKRQALTKWSERLQVIVRTDEKIVSLDRVPA